MRSMHLGVIVFPRRDAALERQAARVLRALLRRTGCLCSRYLHQCQCQQGLRHRPPRLLLQVPRRPPPRYHPQPQCQQGLRHRPPRLLLQVPRRPPPRYHPQPPQPPLQQRLQRVHIQVMAQLLKPYQEVCRKVFITFLRHVIDIRGAWECVMAPCRCLREHCKLFEGWIGSRCRGCMHA